VAISEAVNVISRYHRDVLAALIHHED